LGSQFVSAAKIQEKGFHFKYTTLEMALRQLYSAEK
jgi:NAD dependent epimerase/dehydratase family enzyme